MIIIPPNSNGLKKINKANINLCFLYLNLLDNISNIGSINAKIAVL